MKTSISDYDMRGFKINVAMAEKTALKAPPAHGHGYETSSLIWDC